MGDGHAIGIAAFAAIPGSGMAILFSVADSGKITVKKGTRKGTYKIKVRVTAQGTSTYISGGKTVNVKVRVK